ncbi:MAG TPA: 7-carboxy-7-deazaguanine synthase QueE [Thermoanaerobaculaceae bacterium]|nr:7-carboxy-7-deazaguanine synthase QueE [Thermoanaerobaculaceae bacterium]
MVVAETFASIQGEGVLAGVPSFFIRTSGCNLRCAWCDTPYTSWQPEGRRRSVEELAAEAVASRRRHVVITGGEPLLQRGLGELTRLLAAAGRHITVETAGTLAPEFTCSLLSVSPKTGNSDPHGRFRERHRSLRRDLGPMRALLARHPEYQLKFVVRDGSDMEEITGVVNEVGAPGERVLLMPEGRTAEEVAGRARVVAELCASHGFRYSPRLHLDLFGGGRGV